MRGSEKKNSPLTSYNGLHKFPPAPPTVICDYGLTGTRCAAIRASKRSSPRSRRRRRNESYAVRAFLRREIRDRARLVHRHRRLLEVADQRAERSDSKVERDSARNRAVPSRRSRRQVVAVTDWRWWRTCFPH